MASAGGELLLGEERIFNTLDSDAWEPSAPSRPWSVDEYCAGLTVRCVRRSDDGAELQFDLIAVDAPVANALRRVLIAEVPTMAIDKVYLYQNTSLIQDEVLAHRLGLIPFNVDARLFDYTPAESAETAAPTDGEPDEPERDERHAVVVRLRAACTARPSAPRDAADPRERYVDAHVYSERFEWAPLGSQQSWLPRAVAPLHGDILLAKMRPGQEVEASCHLLKGVGREHAKFSPVATASYRLLPRIELLRRVRGEEAELLRGCFSAGVIELVDVEGGEREARVVDARRDADSRNHARHPQLLDAVRATHLRRHFIFSVESVSALSAAELLVEACHVLEAKSRRLLAAVDELVVD